MGFFGWRTLRFCIASSNPAASKSIFWSLLARQMMRDWFLWRMTRSYVTHWNLYGIREGNFAAHAFWEEAVPHIDFENCRKALRPVLHDSSNTCWITILARWCRKYRGNRIDRAWWNPSILSRFLVSLLPAGCPFCSPMSYFRTSTHYRIPLQSPKLKADIEQY